MIIEKKETKHQMIRQLRKDEKIQQIIQKFHEKGATSPQTALTAKELGLSRIFIRIMERRKEQTKMFIEINGKYKLDQQDLQENK